VRATGVEVSAPAPAPAPTAPAPAPAPTNNSALTADITTLSKAMFSALGQTQPTDDEISTKVAALVADLTGDDESKKTAAQKGVGDSWRVLLQLHKNGVIQIADSAYFPDFGALSSAGIVCTDFDALSSEDTNLVLERTALSKATVPLLNLHRGLSVAIDTVLRPLVGAATTSAPSLDDVTKEIIKITDPEDLATIQTTLTAAILGLSNDSTINKNLTEITSLIGAALGVASAKKNNAGLIDLEAAL
jgi:hypothetical protein